MASKNIQNNSSSSCGGTYDVFLSFRGEDTRKNFVSHLYKALDQRGIYTFKDDETLRRGKQITPEIHRAIGNSRFSVIVFSENYASSEWCLDELVVSLKCRNRFGQTVLPIFYEMDPSNVTDPKGSYAKALAKHEETFKDHKVKDWKAALTKAADLSGFCSWNSKNETQLIEEIIEVVSKNMPRTVLSGDENLVRIDSCVRELKALLYPHPFDVRIVGIWGMGGIGKTTIAKVVYDEISNQFEVCCFLENVKESFRNLSRASLQHDLLCLILRERNLQKGPLGIVSNEIKHKLCRKKVLIILDDVDHLEQIKCVAGKHEWFGPGSRIIITTRDKRLLIEHGVNDIFEVKTLDFVDALKLFSRYAFKQNHPTEEFMLLSHYATKCSGGLPLSLKVLGSFLFGRTKAQWQEKFKELKSNPNVEIQNVLRMSFDGLRPNEKNIFLDIACFYKWEDKDYVTKILDSCGFSPLNGMEVLIEKSLISISKNKKIWMHDMLQEMGWEIVRNESCKEPGNRSRLWTYKDASHVLTKNTGTENVEGLILDLSKSEPLQFNAEVFANMNNLRLLIVCNAHLSTVREYHSKRNLRPSSNAYVRVNEFKQFDHHKVHLSGDFKFLSEELRCLYWHGCPLKSLPLNYHPKNLVELDMCYSHIEQLWDRTMYLSKLEFIDLSHCKRLIKTPDFGCIPNLKRLILDSCTALVEVHPSVGSLRRLVLLSLRNCKSLENFSSFIGLESLEILILSGCSKLKKFPEIVQTMELLMELYLDETGIEELPSSISDLCGLALLNLRDCKNLVCLPDSICSLKSLRFLNVAGCINLDQLPEKLGALLYLEEIDVGRTSLKKLPSSIVRMNHLNRLCCNGGFEQPCNSWKSFSLFCSMPKAPKGLSLFSFPLGFKGFRTLRILQLSDCNLLEIPIGIFFLDYLTDLDLSKNYFSSISSTIHQLSMLEYLRLNYCTELKSIPKLPASIAFVYAHGCASLEDISGSLLKVVSGKTAGQQWDYQSFFLTNCFKMAAYQGFDALHFLKFQLQPILKRQLLGRSDSYAHIKIFVPGRDIPDWFSHQSTESSLGICPADIESSIGKWMGLAVCVVFETYNQEDRGTPYCLNVCVQSGDIDEVNCELQLDEFVDCHHLCLCYVAFPNHWKLRRIGCFYVSLKHDKQVKEVKQFGARLISDEDLEDKDIVDNSKDPIVLLERRSDVLERYILSELKEKKQNI